LRFRRDNFLRQLIKPAAPGGQGGFELTARLRKGAAANPRIEEIDASVSADDGTPGGNGSTRFST
jgi:hypothetical protein